MPRKTRVAPRNNNDLLAEHVAQAAAILAKQTADAAATLAAQTAAQNAAVAAAKTVVTEFVSGAGLQSVISTTVASTLEQLGIDTKNPEAMRADLASLRDWRTTRDMIRNKGIVTVTGLIVTFLVTALATGVVYTLHNMGVISLVRG